MLSDKTFKYLVINHEIIHTSLRIVTKDDTEKISEKIFYKRLCDDWKLVNDTIAY